MKMKRTGKVLMWTFFWWIIIDLNYLSIFHPASKFEGYSTETIIGVILTPLSWLLGLLALMGLLLYLQGDKQEKRAIGTWVNEDNTSMIVIKEKYVKGFTIERRIDGSTFSFKSAGEVLRFMKNNNIKKWKVEVKTNKENKKRISFWKVIGILYLIFVGITTLDYFGVFSGVGNDGNSNVYFTNCDDARAHGADPVYEDEQGYRAALDRDGDGVGCE